MPNLPRSPQPATNKLAPDDASVQYRPRAEHGLEWLKSCGNCVMLQSAVVPAQPSHCTQVEDPGPEGIDKQHVCNLWEAL